MKKNNHKPSPAEIQKHLGDVDYPKTKDELIKIAKDNDAPDEIVDVLKQIEDREYESPADLSKSIGEVE
ncbi:MAG: DUF2795 domain-containing protein [Nanoarchaeota archaeon]